MSTPLKTIKMVKGWNGMSPGHVWTPDMPDIANLLVVNGKAEYVEPPTPEIKFQPQNQQSNQQRQQQRGR